METRAPKGQDIVISRRALSKRDFSVAAAYPCGMGRLEPRDVLRSLADPFAPLLRERIERALPTGATLGHVALEGAELALRQLTFVNGPLTATIASARLRISPRALLGGDAPKVTLVELVGELTFAGDAAAIRAPFRFEPSGRTDAWASGTLRLSCGALEAQALLEVRDDGLRLREVHVVGAGGTELTGQVSALEYSLFGALAGPVRLQDWPLAALLSDDAFARLPLDLHSPELRGRLAIALSGRRDAPEAKITLEVVDLPLRARGRPKFLPHLRLKKGSVEVGVSGETTTAHGDLELVGGGTATFDGRASTSGRTFDAKLEALAAGVVRHLLDLSGATGFTWDSGTIGGTVVITQDPAASPHLEAKLASSAPILSVGAGSFPLVDAAARIAGELTAPALRITATLDGGALAFSLGDVDEADAQRHTATDAGRSGKGEEPERHAPRLSLRGASPRVLARLSRADPSMPLLLSPDDATPEGERERAIVLPDDLILSLFATPNPHDLCADVLLEGGQTRIRVELATKEGAHTTSRLSGTVEPRHARTLFSLDERVKGLALEGAPLTFDLALVGSQVAPSLLGAVGAGKVVVAYEGRVLTLEGLHASVHVTPKFVAFQDLRIGIGRGFLRGAGALLMGANGPTARASFVSENIRIGRAELFPEGAPLDGRAFAHAEVRHGELGTHAEVHLRVEGPTYGFLPKATARLERFGLPRVPEAGDSALEAHALLAPGLVRITDLRASVPGLRAHGCGEARHDGQALRADVRVTASRAWLSRSVMLTLPGAVLGSVEVPVAVTGSIARPETRSELAKAIFQSLTRGLFSRASRSSVLALGPRSIRVPETPYAAGTDDAAHLHAIVHGTLPVEALDELVVTFVGKAS